MDLAFRRLRDKRFVVGFCAAAALGLVTAIRAANPDFLVSIRELTFDYLQRLAPRVHEDVPVRIVDIDEASIAAYGQWPWPRTRIAELVTGLNDLGAAVIAFDVIFAEPDRSSPAQLAESLDLAARPDGAEIRAALDRLPDTDAVLAEALGQAPTVLGFAVLPTTAPRLPDLKAGVAFAGADPATILPAFQSALSALPRLEAAATGTGSVSLSASDTGGVVRRIPLLFSDGKTVYPSLAIEALRVAQGASGLIVRTSTASGEGGGGANAITEIKVGAFPIPTTAIGELWVHYDIDRRERYVSAADVLDPARREALRGQIEGNIVFVGTSAAGLFDIRATPLGQLVPGVSIHAQATEQIISNDFLVRPDWADGLELIATFVAGFLLVLLLPFVGGLATGALALVISGGLTGGAIYLYLTRNLLVDPLYPSVSAFFIFAVGMALLYVLTDKEKRFVRQAFSQYLSPDLVHQLEKRPDQLVLGGELRPMTILFMDVRGFTPISEQLTPTELVHFLNTLLSPLSDAIQASGGTIDKYIGDSIMAFWNAPVTEEDHAALACTASLEMLAIVERLNAEDAFAFKARGLKAQTVQIGIGLNTGEACVGNMGSSRRFNYSVIGDAVNVASRIESSCKAVGAELLVSGETRTEAPDFAYLEAGAIPLKGKSLPVKLFALVGDEDTRRSEWFQQLERHHMALVEALDEGSQRRAAEALAACEAIAPARLAPFYERMGERVADLAIAAQ
ncbi:CHASE2 domain-containing protein [Microvirga tunisiensis]|uniref:CHASE2 domain-containing protein n=1 Tax=Pannonibacter tanglangensis TaxID=2750084 RepID=A0A7X5F4X1_9HYPH|nr:adenylate/guanylate cyclase domain-containing protein [Pannonibacter sp. XCT-53]NBN79798.1 CHASE2 domain-containing protein [Pannonibacter sp. XCT-53]